MINEFFQIGREFRTTNLVSSKPTLMLVYMHYLLILRRIAIFGVSGLFSGRKRSTAPLRNYHLNVKVARYTDNPQLLKKLYDHKIAEEEATQIIQTLCQKYNISFKRGVWNIGVDTMRSWGGRQRKGSLKTKKARNKYPRLTISKGDMNLEVLVHEFAHVVQMNRTGKTNHGIEFVRLLDKIAKFIDEKF